MIKYIFLLIALLVALGLFIPNITSNQLPYILQNSEIFGLIAIGVIVMILIYFVIA